MAIKVLFTNQRFDIIAKREFVAMAFDKNQNTFVIHFK